MQEDISSATDIALKVRKPDQTLTEWVPDIYGSNYLRYFVNEGDLSQAGEYRIQPILTIGGETGRGETIVLTVYEIFT
ncbi:MAG: hypothetical protein Q8J68_14695 [Methanolobus sp.]|nr:hypothetical protein [Methanolobus sp.]